jgi:hypothetical protein
MARQVLGYFVRNPQAIDNLEGIVHWRLLQERVHSTLQETESALTWLVKEGYLREEANPGGEPLYRLNTTQAESALAFLASDDAAEADRNTPAKHPPKTSL